MKYTRRKYLYWLNRAKCQGLYLNQCERALSLFEQGELRKSKEVLDEVVPLLKKAAYDQQVSEFYLGHWS